jgi:hypothetical protein
MPKRNRHIKNNRKRSSRGGGMTDDVSNWWYNNITNGSLWQNTKNKFDETKNYVSTLVSGSQNTNGYQQQQYPQPPKYVYGGKKKTKKRGGSLASPASPVSGLATAKAHNWVGGKTRKRRRCK